MYDGISGVCEVTTIVDKREEVETVREDSKIWSGASSYSSIIEGVICSQE